jgi:hypothetical protein
LPDLIPNFGELMDLSKKNKGGLFVFLNFLTNEVINIQYNMNMTNVQNVNVNDNSTNVQNNTKMEIENVNNNTKNVNNTKVDNVNVDKMFH